VNLYMGYDGREKIAYDVGCRSLRRYWDIEPTPLIADRLAACGLLWRLQDRRGQLYDLTSNAPCSTEFAISRFLVPLLAQTGWALFVDCDVVFLDDPRKILAEADSRYAVQVVQHDNGHKAGMKMDGQQQTLYPRKNWSSVMLFNCDHPANRRLTVRDINERPGRDLHAFYWLADSEVGLLNPDWNWLVGVQPKPDNPKIAHYTLGGPWIPDWEPHEHDDIWRAACGSTRIKQAA
jgi:hypothetical protein